MVCWTSWITTASATSGWLGVANGANHLLAEPYEFLIDERDHLVLAAKVSSELVRFLEASERLGVPVNIHVASMHGARAKQAWSDNALPLFEVEAPMFKCVQEQPDSTST